MEARSRNDIIVYISSIKAAPDEYSHIYILNSFCVLLTALYNLLSYTEANLTQLPACCSRVQYPTMITSLISLRRIIYNFLGAYYI